jgi:hypothetical protein
MVQGLGFVKTYLKREKYEIWNCDDTTFIAQGHGISDMAR